ncbi:NAD(P)/FAD-dependent oxidoreductase [Maridesulfovibrio salexigens]|uniref:Pyridine nucleotide-disulfide oxidoreductase family protein n=1 Tax=Maridesulfovibrio salexigens (strain ATCC 14822 / DSM 2638 / NCIMB 8403 / VKM B-1763) TaxID=526222 RepID=C6C1L4_MARSD|nr:FAD-dependent oxidoreductase [Maridesulfovibrio salexigens]ACS81189.1 pyridine nucleotide-disulfide oxidoreductase family protein [Maridesulfovibrio salexigens DSM 2638]
MGELVIAGAGHAHMQLMEAIPELIADGQRVTVIGPDERHYYSGMGPGMLGGIYRPAEISFPVKSMVESRGGTFVLGKVARIDPHKRIVILETGQEVPYDVLSCNLGSSVSNDLAYEVSTDIYTVKPIQNLLQARIRIQEIASERPVRIGICGGGPAALEIAGNAWTAAKEQGRFGAKIKIFTGSEFLHNQPERVRNLAIKSLNKRGIEIVQGSYVERVVTGDILLQNGLHYEQDIIFLALGVKPSKVFAASDLPIGKDGGLRVNRYLQSVSHPEIFGGGDCIWFEPNPLDKVGVYAVRQNPVLVHNVRAQLKGLSLKDFDPGDSYLLIFNTGDEKGILLKNGLSFSGSLAFRIKDYIDRKFVRRFKVNGS